MTHEEKLNRMNEIVEKTARYSNERLAMRLDQHADWYDEYVSEALSEVDEETYWDTQAEVQMLREAVHRIKQLDNSNK